MRKIGIYLLALLALLLVVTGCGDKKEEPKKTESQEAAPTVPLLTQEDPVYSSDDQATYDDEKEGTQTAEPSVTSSKKPSTTTKSPTPSSSVPQTSTTKAPVEPPSVSTTAPATSVPVTTTYSGSGRMELPDHNWN